MRSRRPAPDQVADVARRRLELLSAELAEIRPEGPSPSSHGDRDGSGELPAWPEETDGGGRESGVGRRTGSPVPHPGGEATGASEWSVRRPAASARTRSDGPDDPSGPVPGTRSTEPAPGRHAHRSLGLRADATRWVADRLPAGLQGRVRLTGGHLAVVALILAAGLALTAWWVARADGDVTTVSDLPSVGVPAGGDPLTGAGSGTSTSGAASPAPGSVGSSEPGRSAAASAGAGAQVPGSAVAPTAATSAAGPTGPTGPAGSAGSIVVDVTGKVRRPGIATLPTGSRVVDAIEAAGGAKRGAGLGSLNLARVLTDGEQVVVGLPAPAGIAASAASAPTSGAAVPMVNVNTATESQLEELPGVGPVTAAAILDYRTENGPFGSVDALLEVSGIGDATLAKIAPYVTL